MLQRMHQCSAVGGVQVAVRGIRGPYAGLCNVYLNEQQVAASLDLSRRYEQKCLLFMSDLLPFGDHVLRIECCGQRGAASVDQKLMIDGFLWLAAY